ncbi:MAG: DUF4142 domain-containing protein [Hyphomicrobiales bacterium]|nr:DUF4142 domain-containing protein [Hyphomicrobiales bacterium]
MAPAEAKGSLKGASIAAVQGITKMLKTISRGGTGLAAIICAAHAAAQTPIPPSPNDFVVAASQSDQYEIEAGKDAEVQSNDLRVRTFAQQMIRDHTRTIEILRQAAMSSGLPIPEPSVSSDQARLLSSLQSLRGAEFDRTYARQQVLAHEQAVTVADSFAAAGSDANLRNAAASALPIIQEHLKMAQQLRTDVGG